MHVISVPSGPMHVRIDGASSPTSKTVVFSNSLGTDVRLWDLLLPHLPTTLRYVRYDMRGHGLSAHPDGTWTIADLAGDAVALIEALGLNNVCLVGLSVGGMVAQHVAATRGDLLDGAAYLCTGMTIGTDDLWDMRIKTATEDGMAPLVDGVMQRWFSPRFLEGDNPARAPWREMVFRTPGAGYAGVCQALKTADLRDLTPTIRCPSLAVAGAHDGATPPDVVQAIADAIPGCGFHVIDGAGHLPCVETPVTLARHLIDFFDQIGYR